MSELLTEKQVKAIESYYTGESVAGILAILDEMIRHCLADYYEHTVYAEYLLELKDLLIELEPNAVKKERLQRELKSL